MNVRKTFLAIALASAFVAPIAVRAATVMVDVDVAPPAPPVYERMPAREGYVITPGYYRFDTERREHTWVKGEYQAERRGEHYIAPEWRAQDGRYHFSEGRWERDK